MMKKALGKISTVLLLQKPYERLLATRSRRWQMKVLSAHGLLDQVAGYIDKNGLVVKQGPFAGLLYPRESVLSRWAIPKLIGTYECELHPFLEKFRHVAYDCVIDIGCAEGYYACGLARLLRKPVYAFDPEPVEKAFCLEMARLNGLQGLVIAKELFTVDDMRAFRDKRCLVVCDCEGFESQLFTAETLSETANWDLIIELHGATNTTLPALPWPHALHLIPSEQRSGLEDELRGDTQSFLICDSEDRTLLHDPQ